MPLLIGKAAYLIVIVYCFVPLKLHGSRCRRAKTCLSWLDLQPASKGKQKCFDRSEKLSNKMLQEFHSFKNIIPIWIRNQFIHKSIKYKIKIKWLEYCCSYNPIHLFLSAKQDFLMQNITVWPFSLLLLRCKASSALFTRLTSNQFMQTTDDFLFILNHWNLVSLSDSTLTA